MNERETAALQVEDLTYNADGLIPCIVQDEQTREVLMMAPHHQPGYNLVLVA